MARRPEVVTQPDVVKGDGRGAKWRGSLDADIIIANAPDPVFVSDLEGKILQANDAVSQLLGFRQDEVLEQSLSRFISAAETREFMAALREVVERGVTRNARLNPRSASGQVIPTTLNASALRDPDGKVIGAIGILRDIRAYDQAGPDLENSKSDPQETILDLENYDKMVQAREPKLIALGNGLDSLRKKARGWELGGLVARSDMVTQDGQPAVLEPAAAASRLRAQVETLERRLRKRDEQRRAMLHIMGDLNEFNKRLANQRKATLHILADYEQDRRRLARQTGRLDNSRRALLHILQDSHKDKLRLEASRKAMIHIMGDVRDTTTEIQRREQELRNKQEQLVQAGKLATLGELTTGVAHELNNPLNNIDLLVGNAVDLIDLAVPDTGRILGQLRQAMQQVRKATEIISHLRTFGRAAPASRESISLRQVIERALSLMQEQLRLREIEVTIDLGPQEPIVSGNSIQLEQVFINLLTNARAAVADCIRKAIRISGW